MKYFKIIFLIIQPFFIYCQTFETNQYIQFIKTRPNFKKSTVKSEQEVWTTQETWTELKYIFSTQRDSNCINRREYIYNAKDTNIVIFKYYECDSLTEIKKTVYLPEKIIEYDSLENKVETITKYDSKKRTWTKKIKESYGDFKYTHYIDSIKKIDSEYKNGDLLITRIYYGLNHDSCLQFDPNNKLVYKTIWKYNQFGNVIYEEDYSFTAKKPDLYITQVSYIYDNQNNWVEKIETQQHYPAFPLDERYNTLIKIKTHKRTLIY